MSQEIIDGATGELEAISQVMDILGNAAVEGIGPAPSVCLVWLAERVMSCTQKLRVVGGGDAGQRE